MAIFGPKPWKNVNFGFFSILCFYSLERRFFVVEYHKIHFPGLYCPLPNKVGKMAIIRPKPWKNVNFGFFSILCFYSLERRFFVVEYHKIHFPGLYCVKKKGWKMAIFGPKPWLTLLQKCQFFDFLKFLFL